MSNKFLKMAFAGLVLGVSGFANAALIIYTDSTLFESSAGTLSIEDFTSESLGYSTSNYSAVYDGFTLSSIANGDNSGILNSNIAPRATRNTAIGNDFFGQNFYGWGNGNGGLGPQTNFSFSAGIVAFGFDFFNADFSDSYNIAINNLVVATIAIDGTGFFGVIATGENITSASITNLSTGGFVGTAGLDNIRVTSEVPEPSTLAIFALGLMGLASRRFMK
jgi:hypothetical protein